MTTTLEIAKEVQAWQGNYEMLKAVAGGLPEAILSRREAAMAAFVGLGFPTTKHEEWKYTSLRPLAAGDYQPAFRPVDAGIDMESGAWYDRVLPPGVGAPLVVLVNGHFDAGLSRLGNGPEVSSLKAAMSVGHAAVLAHLGQVATFDDRAMVALNTAIAGDGAFVYLPKGYIQPTPITILHLMHGDRIASNVRTLVVAEEGSEGKVVEVWLNEGKGSNWENHVTEVIVNRGAKVEWLTVQNELGTTDSLTNFMQVLQAADSTFRSTVMSSSGKMVRNDLQVRHTGSNCSSYLNGLSLLDGETHCDHHTLVDHALPHCYSNETYKTVLEGKSTAVFNGKVMVRPDAQKTNAFQSNKTLLLSDTATINAKPQLEIFADDVKCSHGATTGRIDQTALFYLRSRGLSETKAKALLTYAFGAEVLDQIGIDAWREALEAHLMERLTD